MENRIRTYTGEDINVTYDGGRCIHVGECLKRLHSVFDKSRRPWVLPDGATADSVAETILHCPSGALHYERQDGGANEPVPDYSTIRLSRRGPLFVQGDFTIVNGAGETVLTDTRATLCRCGASANKPFCDNSHIASGFEGATSVAEPQTNLGAPVPGSLRIETETNGPLHISGNFTLLNNLGEAVYQGTEEWLCRCGGSANKPFCDNTHRKIGFVAE